jgi:hypothetical protein
MYDALRAIFRALEGDEAAHAAKQELRLRCDAFFGTPYNFILEFDGGQHFSTSRLQSLQMYPVGAPLGYNINSYRMFCEQHRQAADEYRRNKRPDDFPFEGGRTAQRAYLDAVRDLLPPLYGLNPTVRISHFEVLDVQSNDAIGQAIIREILAARIANFTSASSLETNT